MKWMGNSEKFEYIKGWFRTQYLGWTNCVCDLFQPLRDLKAPKAVDSEVKHSRSHMSLGLDPILKRLSLGSSYAWPLLPWSRVFELPVQGLQSVKLGGLSGRSSGTIGNENGNCQTSMSTSSTGEVLAGFCRSRRWLVRTDPCQKGQSELVCTG